MKFDDYNEKLAQLLKLIESARTGTPAELARRLNVSERTARRLIERLREKGKPIAFCRRIKSYIIKN